MRTVFRTPTLLLWVISLAHVSREHSANSRPTQAGHDRLVDRDGSRTQFRVTNATKVLESREIGVPLIEERLSDFGQAAAGARREDAGEHGDNKGVGDDLSL